MAKPKSKKCQTENCRTRISPVEDTPDFCPECLAAAEALNAASVEVPPARLSWPTKPEHLVQPPRLFRIHRLNAYEWQAYVTHDGEELPIGKPDLFELIRGRVAGAMKAEGQAEFLAKKKADAEAAGKPKTAPELEGSADAKE